MNFVQARVKLQCGGAIRRTSWLQPTVLRLAVYPDGKEVLMEYPTGVCVPYFFQSQDFTANDWEVV